MARPSCFGDCSSCNVHTRGSWRALSGSAPYRLNHSLWHELGLSPIARSAASHYGRCDDVSDTTGVLRQLYEWVPDQCELAAVSQSRTCAVLAGKQLMISGDSTAGQVRC